MSDRIIISGDVQLNNRISNNVKLSDSVAGNTGSFMPVYEDNYERLLNKPRINGVELVGNKTTEDLNIVAGVASVNGKTGAVRLKASDVNALPDTTFIPTKVSELINDSEFATQSSVPTKLSQLENNTGFIDAAIARSVAPVQSVNGQTRAVVLSASDVGALPDDTVIPTVPTDISAFNNDSGYITASALPTNVSDLNNDAGYLTVETDPTVPSWAKASSKPTYTASEVGALPDTYVAPVSSVNSKTGVVTLTASDVGALPNTYTAPVASVNGQTGAVVLDAEDVGALPEDTQFTIGYDESVSVGSAAVGEAVTGEPNYTPSGTVTGTVTMEGVTLMTSGKVGLNYGYSTDYKLKIFGITFTPTTTPKNIVTGISNLTFNGNGVKFAVEQEQ